MEEFLDFPDLRRSKVLALLHHAQHVPPGGEVVQAHPELAHRLLRLGKNVIVEIERMSGELRRLVQLECFGFTLAPIAVLIFLTCRFVGVGFPDTQPLEQVKRNGLSSGAYCLLCCLVC